MRTTTPELDDFRRDAANERARLMEKAHADFEEKHPGLIEALEPYTERNTFAASIYEQATRKAYLSDKQASAAWSLIERERAKVAEREQAAAKASTKSGQVDFSKIKDLFDTARSNGLKRPKFYAGDVKISLASEHSANAGALYVVRDPDVYQGKIVGDQFKASRDCAEDTLQALRELATNPAEYARLTGKQTGRCCCCGRELTDPESIANGIGPICATKWGL